MIPGTYLYVESSSPRKEHDKARLQSVVIKGTSKNCAVNVQIILFGVL